MRHWIFSWMAVLAVGVSCMGQGATASLSGRVTDPSAKVIVGAAVVAINSATGQASPTVTNHSGDYVFPALEPGTYNIQVTAPGFRKHLTSGLVVHVEDRIKLNFSMLVGIASQTVQVSGQTPPLNTEDATLGTVIERQVIENMPLNGRSFQGLISLAPGVSTVAASSSQPGEFVVDGQRPDTNYVTVDGVSANAGSSSGGSPGAAGTGSVPTNSATGGLQSIVSLDDIQEFKISTSSFAPEFGRTPGGQISVATREGTDAYHGDVFGYLRNTVLDANDWFLNAAGKPRGIVQQNDFGGVFGGPVLKHKLFFFGSYEGLRLNAPTPSVKLVPTQSARNLAAQAVENGFKGYMAQFLNAFPLPDDNPTTACTTFANCLAPYTASFPSRSQLDSSSLRIDYIVNSAMSVFARYSHAPSSLTAENSADANSFKDSANSFTAGATHTFSPAATNVFRFNLSSTSVLYAENPLLYNGGIGTIFPAGYAQPPADFLAGVSPSQLSPDIAMQVRFASDGLVLSPQNGDGTNLQLNLTDTLAWIKGSHQVKFGVDYRLLRPTSNQVNFNWNDTFAQRATINGSPFNYCPAADLPSGSSKTTPGYICGQATLSNIQHNYPRAFRIQQYSLFAQDTWQIRPRLSVTYGLRWEIDPAYQSTDSRFGFSLDPATFDLSNFSNIALLPFGAPAYQINLHEIAPRIGLAYQLSTNASWGRVLRAGWGVFYDTGDQSAIRAATPWNSRFNNTGGGTLQTFVPFPIARDNAAFVTPVNANLNLPVSNGGFDVLIDPHFALPYVQQANVTLEQSLGSQQTLSVAYVGAFGHRLLGEQAFPADKGNPAVFSLNGVPDSLDIFGNYSFSSYNALQTRFQRQFANGFSALASYTWAHSIDNASSNILPQLALPTASQLSAGLPVALLKGNSDFDVRHDFSFSLVYNVPAPFHQSALSRALLGGWSFDPIYHFQTGLPVDIFTGINGALGGTSFEQRPNQIPGVPVYVTGSACVAQYESTAQYAGCPGGYSLNLAPVTASEAASAGCEAPTTGKTANAKGAFCTPAPISGQAVSGNLGRNTLRSFGLQELDFSLHRTFPVGERVHLQFEADMFNVFNHPEFGPFTASSANLNNANFGVVTEMANSYAGAANASGAGTNPVFAEGAPRNVQLALKVVF